MLKHWNQLLNTDCRVVLIEGQAVYPIFKNGSSSIFSEAHKTLVNDEIRPIDNILIFIREPRQRFVKGVNEYGRINGMDPRQVYDLVKDGKLADRHFAPQWMWLLHLYRYHKGYVTMKPLSELKKYCPAHKNKSIDTDVPLDTIPEFIDPDLSLMDKLHTKIPLEELVRNQNVLS